MSFSAELLPSQSAPTGEKPDEGVAVSEPGQAYVPAQQLLGCSLHGRNKLQPANTWDRGWEGNGLGALTMKEHQLHQLGQI